MLTRLSFHIVKIIGTALIVAACTSYFLNIPQERNEILNGIELVSGIMLVSLDLQAFAKELKNALLDRLFPNRKR